MLVHFLANALRDTSNTIRYVTSITLLYIYVIRKNDSTSDKPKAICDLLI